MSDGSNSKSDVNILLDPGLRRTATKPGRDRRPVTPKRSPHPSQTEAGSEAVNRMRRMRAVDHWLGLPLCFVVGCMCRLARRILPRRKRTISGQGIIAVYKFFGLGSILEATPLLRAIREQYPQGRLAMVTFDSNADLVRSLDLATDVRVIRTHTHMRFVLDVLKQIIWLRRNRVEAVVDLEFFSKFSTLLSFCSRAPIRVGFHLNDFWRHGIVTHPIYFNYFRHISEVYEEAGLPLGVTVEDRTLQRLPVNSVDGARVREWLTARGWNDEPLLGVNVNAGELSFERRWPLKHFRSLIEILCERRADLRIVLTGSPVEKRYVQSLIDMLDERTRLQVWASAGDWTLSEFAASLALFDGFVTGDSGPMHLAAAQGTPLVTIWGPSRPQFYAPPVSPLRCVHHDIWCGPCVCMFTTFEGMWCEHEAWCMQEIEPGIVAREVEKMLETTIATDPSDMAAGSKRDQW